jgi:hypothetical protein
VFKKLWSCWKKKCGASFFPAEHEDKKKKEIRELKCENQKLKDQLKKTEEKVKIFEKKKDFQNAKIEKLRKEYMKIIKALNKKNELKCENQKLKDQLKRAE